MLRQGVTTVVVFKAHRLCVSLNSRVESNKEEEEDKCYDKVNFFFFFITLGQEMSDTKVYEP